MAAPANRAPLYKIEEICALLRTTEAAHVAVAYSGDTGFYSGASALAAVRWMRRACPTWCCPGLSSVQLLAAALGRPWQDWKLVSAHGCACDPVALLCRPDTTFFLTGGSETPATLCAEADAMPGWATLQATVGENLGTPPSALCAARRRSWPGRQLCAAQRAAGGNLCPCRSAARPACRTKPSSAAKRR